MDIGGRAREDLWSPGLSKANTRSVHTRGTKRASTVTRSSTGSILRTITTPTRDRRDANGGGCGARRR